MTTDELSIRARLAACAAALCLPTACSTPSKGAAAQSDPKPIEELVKATNQPVSIGKFLAELDGSIRAWNRLLLTAETEEDRRKARLLEDTLMTATHKRRSELVEQLESGPLSNRIVAACALGFTRDAEVQSPLLAALEDGHPEVVSNALFGLLLLGRADTPLEPICRHLQSGRDEVVRLNAAQCAATLVRAGARSECIAPAARLGLSDADPGVRVQCALILGTLLDGPSLGALIERLRDEVPLVRSAAARAVGFFGARSAPDKGTAARALAKAYAEAPSQQREPVRRALVELAGIDQGSEAKAWSDWAHKLP